MEAELQKGGAFLKMLPTDQKVVTIKSDPVQCKSNFVEYGKEPKNEFQIKVQIEGDQKEVTWSIGNRNVMSQLVALTKHHNLSSLVGAKLLLKTSGTDVKNRSWFILLLAAPGVQVNGVPTPAQQGTYPWLDIVAAVWRGSKERLMAAKSECLEPPGMAESPELPEPIAVATCKACRRTLPLSEMAKNGFSRSGVQYFRRYCKPCYHRRLMNQAWKNYGGKIEAYLAVHGPFQLKDIASGIGASISTVCVACGFAVDADLLDVTRSGFRFRVKIFSLKRGIGNAMRIRVVSSSSEISEVCPHGPDLQISKNKRKIVRPSAKLTECEVRQIRERYQRGERPSDIAVDFPQVAKSTVRAIAQGADWEAVVVGAA